MYTVACRRVFYQDGVHFDDSWVVANKHHGFAVSALGSKDLQNLKFDESGYEQHDVESDGKEKAELNEFIPTLEQVRHRQVEAYHRGKQ